MLFTALATAMAGRAQEPITTDSEIWRCLVEGDSSDAFMWRGEWIDWRSNIAMADLFARVGSGAALLSEEKEEHSYRWYYRNQSELHRLDASFMRTKGGEVIVDQFTFLNLTDSCTRFIQEPFIPGKDRFEVKVLTWVPNQSRTQVRQATILVKNTLDYNATSARATLVLKDGDEVVAREPFAWEGRLIPNEYKMVPAEVLSGYDVGRTIDMDAFSIEVELEEVLPKPANPDCDVYGQLSGE